MEGASSDTTPMGTGCTSSLLLRGGSPGSPQTSLTSGSGRMIFLVSSRDEKSWLSTEPPLNHYHLHPPGQRGLRVLITTITTQPICWDSECHPHAHLMLLRVCRGVFRQPEVGLGMWGENRFVFFWNKTFEKTVKPENAGMSAPCHTGTGEA